MSSNHFEGRVASLTEVVQEIARCDPHVWCGVLDIEFYGKAGELYFLSSLLPGIKDILPYAEVRLTALEQYKCVLEGRYTNQWDNIRYVPPVLDRTTQTSNLNMGSNPGFARDGNSISVNPFRGHWWYDHDDLVVSDWFAYAFADAIGVPRKFWQPSWPSDRDYLLALPTLNKHSGRRRQLPFNSSQWSTLAKKARKHGLTPYASGDVADGRLDMPGWEWLDCSLGDLLPYIHHAKGIIGGQSGLPLAAAVFGKGMSVILDDSWTKHLWKTNKGGYKGSYIYDPGACNEWDDSRCHYFPLNSIDDSLDDEAFHYTISILETHPWQNQ